MKTSILNCFKTYDIRGQVPQEIDENLAYALGGAIVEKYAPKGVAIGNDSRVSAPSLNNALIMALEENGVSASHIGLCGTEEIYFAVANEDYDVGIMITGSHNPASENGFKIMLRGALPASDIADLERKTAEFLTTRKLAAPKTPLQYPYRPVRQRWLDWLLKYVDFSRDIRNKKFLRIVADAGNGSAGPVLRQLASRLPFDFILLNAEPDGNFPNGVPNPLLPEKRERTALAVRENRADVGIAFDGDFDRCFFYDSGGNFIEGYYLVGLLASELLKGQKGAKIIHDPRVYWNTLEMVTKAGGLPIMSRTGHVFMKEKMRSVNALYGGEMSSHHYFRDYAYCDSGILAMLLTLKFLQNDARTLEEYNEERRMAYPCSGEINFKVRDPERLLSKIWSRYASDAWKIDRIDGINIEFKDWRFNARISNTEPLLRLNLETRANHDLLEEKLEHLKNLIRAE